MENFTQREIKILNLLANGMTDNEIAKRLKLSEQTVKPAVATLKRILGAKNRPHLVYQALKQGVI